MRKRVSVNAHRITIGRYGSVNVLWVDCRLTQVIGKPFALWIGHRVHRLAASQSSDLFTRIHIRR